MIYIRSLCIGLALCCVEKSAYNLSCSFGSIRGLACLANLLIYASPTVLFFDGISHIRYSLLLGVALSPSFHGLFCCIANFFSQMVQAHAYHEENARPLKVMPMLFKAAVGLISEATVSLVAVFSILVSASEPIWRNAACAALLHFGYVLAMIVIVLLGVRLAFENFSNSALIQRLHAEALLRSNVTEDANSESPSVAEDVQKYSIMVILSAVVFENLRSLRHNGSESLLTSFGFSPIDQLDLLLLVVLGGRTAFSWWYWMQVDRRERKFAMRSRHASLKLQTAASRSRLDFVPRITTDKSCQANIGGRLPLWAIKREPPDFPSMSLSGVESENIQDLSNNHLETQETASCTAMASDLPSVASSRPIEIAGKKELRSVRPLKEIVDLLNQESGPSQLSDADIFLALDRGVLRLYALEKHLQDHTRAVHIRRQVFSTSYPHAVAGLRDVPYLRYDFTQVTGACCENVIGTIPVPLGYAGPLRVNGLDIVVPLATTEGCLVASVNRGCRAVSSAAGISAFVYGDRMTRGPVCRMPTAGDAVRLKLFLEEKRAFECLRDHFESTSRFAKLKSVYVALAGRLAYLRFEASTGDAMGMNMVSKGVEKALQWLKMKFPVMEVLSLSGNYCTDKKSTALNWIRGRGKSVVCDVAIPQAIVEKVLKTSVEAMVELNVSKNLIGSAMAGSVGGFNAHAANIVTAVFVATGQDIAQNISSSHCLTQMEKTADGALYVSCTMPSVEVGTIGGGTILAPQNACLQMLRCSGSSSPEDRPGANAEQLSIAVAATVLAGEVSLMAALSAGHLVDSHMKHNRSYAVLPSPSPPARSSPSAQNPKPISTSSRTDSSGVHFSLTLPSSSSDASVSCKSL